MYCKCGSSSSYPTDYRPITITPVLATTFEQLLAKSLNAFAENTNLFPKFVVWLSKGLGICNAFLTFVNVFQKALDSGCEVHRVGFDLIVVFD